jgi:hypothetical protein
MTCPPPVACSIGQVVGVAQLVQRRRRFRPWICVPSESPALHVSAVRVETDRGAVRDEWGIETPQCDHRLMPQCARGQAIRVDHNAPPDGAREVRAGLIGNARQDIGDEGRAWDPVRGPRRRRSIRIGREVPGSAGARIAVDD